MFIFDALDGTDLLIGMAATFVLLYLAIKIGLMKNWFDPFGPPLFQAILTVVLLGSAYIPVGHVMMFFAALLLIAYMRPNQHVECPAETHFWERSLDVLLAISIVVNIFLVSQKGLVILKEDVGASRLEFYQGWGAFQRFNAGTLVLFGVRWAKWLITGRGRERNSILLLMWVVYLGLTMGSKAGLITILAYIGSALCFERRAVSVKSFLPFVAVAMVSMVGMFYIFFGATFLAQLAFRFVSFADGPFYYYSLPSTFQVSHTYVLDQFFTVLRVQGGLSEPGLGTLINYWYFGVFNELVGPNPQIFVESQAVAGAWYPVYYLTTAVIIGICLRLCRTPYSLALFSSFFVTLLIDAQYAFSNLANIVVTIITVALIGTASEAVRRAAKTAHA